LFAGSDGGGERWAIVCALVETAKLNGVEPYAAPAYGRRHPVNRLDDLLPWSGVIPACNRQHHASSIVQSYRVADDRRGSLRVEQRWSLERTDCGLMKKKLVFADYAAVFPRKAADGPGCCSECDAQASDA
jgi:hypothetical protein